MLKVLSFSDRERAQYPSIIIIIIIIITIIIITITVLYVLVKKVKKSFPRSLFAKNRLKSPLQLVIHVIQKCHA